MKTNLCLFAFCSVILSSCGTSKTPTEADINNILKEQFVSCPIIEIQNVKKINGAPGERENYYNIKATFDLLFKPIPENTEIWNEFSKKNVLRKSLDAEYDIVAKTIREKAEKLDEEIKAKYQALSEEESRQPTSDWSHQQRELLEKEKAGSISLHWEKINQLGLGSALTADSQYQDQLSVISKHCKTNGLGTQLAGRAYLSNSDNFLGRVEFIGKGGTMSYTVDWLMLKTEQGWQLKL